MTISAHIAIWQGGWKSPDGVPEHSGRNPYSNSWPLTNFPKAPGHYLKCQKCSEGPLIDNPPAKRVKIGNVAYLISFPLKTS